jgi:hypothetical protein
MQIKTQMKSIQHFMQKNLDKVKVKDRQRNDDILILFVLIYLMSVS